MKTTKFWIRLSLGLVALCSAELFAQQEARQSEPPKNEEGFAPLFNGKDLSGWTGDTTGKSVANGVLLWSGGGSIWTEAEYSDFEFRFEFTMSPGANNGLAIRWDGVGDPAYVAMCELQLLDNQAEKYQNLDPRQYHGSAYGMAAAKRGFLRPPGEWNYQKVRVVGSTIQVTLNGTLILDTDLSEISEYLNEKDHPGKTRNSGHLGFAGHGDEHQLQFRNLRIKRL